MERSDLTDPESPRTLGANPPRSSRRPYVAIIVSLIGLLLIAALAYFVHALDGQQKQQLLAFQAHTEEVSQALGLVEKRLDENAAQIADLESRVQVTMDRIGVTQEELSRARTLARRLEKEQKQHVTALQQDIQKKADAQQVSELKEQSTQKFEGVDREITDVKAEVESTKKDLAGTIAELSNLGVKLNEQGQMIATNQTGLEELRRRGERDYVTFELKKKIMKRVAGVTLELRDTDGGRAPDADIRVYTNDTEVERKDIPQNVSVNFYVGAARIPYELVLNEITNKPDTCKGYISVPKDMLPKGPPGLSPRSR